jgi:hypothetical protein
VKKFDIDWIDSYREPLCPADPNFPNGKDVRCPDFKGPKCLVQLPYPARRIGLYTIKCNECGTSVAATTAGRPDDPKSVEFPCAKQ